jgi:hypothetical protein
MNSYCVDELAKIAMLQKNTPLFRALDKLAMSASGGRAAVGSVGMGHGSGLGGSTSMGGFSTHCDKCFCKVKESTKVCPKCGSKLSQKRDMKGEEEELKDTSSPYGENADTGGEAAEMSGTIDDDTSEMGKYSAKKKPWWKAKDVLDTPAGQAKAVGGLGLSSFGAIKLHQITKDPPGEKRASTRIGPRGWNFKRKVSQKFVSSPALKVRSWKKKSKRSAQGLLP